MNRYTATAMLGAATLCYLAALPFAQTFAGGLLASAFGAAMVGGLADWFAVSALFRKPLGIPWRTAVIPRNRERLFQMIVQMVQEELLSKENIKNKLEERDISRIIITYLDERGGVRNAKRILHKLIADIWDKIDPDEIGRIIERFIKEESGRLRLAPLLQAAGEWSIERDYDDKALRFLLDELAKIAAAPPMRQLLTSVLGKALELYEGEKRRRKVFNTLAGISADSLAGLIQAKLVVWLADLKDSEHPLRQKARVYCAATVRRLAEDPLLQQAVEVWKEDFFQRVDIKTPIVAMLGHLRQGDRPQEIAQWFRHADKQIDQLLAEFQSSPAQQRRVGEFVKTALMELIDAHHAEVGRLVRERLAQFSDQALVEFIEGRVGDDLQMIRINGSIVGGFAGAVLYLLTCWL